MEDVINMEDRKDLESMTSGVLETVESITGGIKKEDFSRQFEDRFETSGLWREYDASAKEKIAYMLRFILPRTLGNRITPYGPLIPQDVEDRNFAIAMGDLQEPLEQQVYNASLGEYEKLKRTIGSSLNDRFDSVNWFEKQYPEICTFIGKRFFGLSSEEIGEFVNNFQPELKLTTEYDWPKVGFPTGKDVESQLHDEDYGMYIKLTGRMLDVPYLIHETAHPIHFYAGDVIGPEEHVEGVAECITIETLHEPELLRVADFVTPENEIEPQELCMMLMFGYLKHRFYQLNRQYTQGLLEIMYTRMAGRSYDEINDKMMEWDDWMKENNFSQRYYKRFGPVIAELNGASKDRLVAYFKHES